MSGWEVDLAAALRSMFSQDDVIDGLVEVVRDLFN